MHRQIFLLRSIKPLFFIEILLVKQARLMTFLPLPEPTIIVAPLPPPYAGLTVVLLVVIAFFSLLPALYAISVHIFLFAFRERPTLFGLGPQWRRHWYPILLRLGYASMVVAVIIVAGSRCYHLEECRVSSNYWQADAMSVSMHGSRSGRDPQSIDGNPVASSSSSTTCQEQGGQAKSSASQLIVGIMLVLITIIVVSIKLLLQTRTYEVDGPIPPSNKTTTSDDNRTINHKSSYYDLGGKTVFITGAKLSNERAPGIDTLHYFCSHPVFSLWFGSHF